ncbi:MAG: hypothetical protein A2086_01175 [Spirochaetes bacterium GWD1_27_9]|nr:MAG: hypothetical protein A2Z98_15680 [Spirochaetes bacterium GWB1_27_13]OHD24390.1 MAG: hypothetical protein A2Y34_02285 [Spirochaetes bacterium GWC1_27_15]OHD33664.1 MAG: hypothetical protein A2086_01175 [Spirochaetes bacterium GWD1_27_9]
MIAFNTSNIDMYFLTLIISFRISKDKFEESLKTLKQNRFHIKEDDEIGFLLADYILKELMPTEYKSKEKMSIDQFYNNKDISDKIKLLFKSYLAYIYFFKGDLIMAKKYFNEIIENSNRDVRILFIYSFMLSDINTL